MNLSVLQKVSEYYNEGFTHFFVDSKVVSSKIEGNARIVLENVVQGTLIAIIGGVVVDHNDDYIAMPMGTGIFLHQVSNQTKGTVNHSCNPNCKIQGFNKLIAKRDIIAGEELTIDYGSVSIGKGFVIIENCNCKSTNCRHTIKTDDFKKLDTDDLCLYGKYFKEHNL